MTLGKLAASCGLVLASWMFTPKAEAAYTMTVVQSGPNVVASGSGSINTTGLSNSGTASWFANIYPSFGEIAVGPTSSVGVNFWSGFSGPTGLGSGPQVVADSGSGTLVAVIANSGLELQSGYASGTAITGSATWNSQTIAGLGLTPGTYTWTWGTGPNADSFTLVVGSSQVPGTPVPSSVYLVAVGILALGITQAFRMRRAA